ncbi:cytochrome b/b6 domain-containing protein [Acrocarpospora pleiomorpha]|uniref:cytochrome b/b6 domain-containing protein n=1 Tax=Acrocarpospora pleiomorpha TaxID=90975 RepID=UPI0012D325A1|nr:cytochrome b/b6 domain-containing protein [Acrocarpospora pleiomorpha]
MRYVQRYGRAARWFHALVYTVVLVLLTTGWWFIVDRYRHPLPGPDGLHETTGLLLIGATLAYGIARARAVAAFLGESIEYRRGDGRWLAAWPRATLTGRFPYHDGRYDPGQRLANVVMVSTLTLIALSGLGMLYLPAGAVSLLAADVHRWATFVLTPVIVGHIVVAAGVLPGYQGVWRSIHLGGRLPRAVAHRIWPGWLDHYERATSGRDGTSSARRRRGDTA